MSLRITASEWTWVRANGLVYSLDHDTPAEVPLDNEGCVTVIGMASDIVPPILHAASDSFAEIVNIYPNGKILSGLQGIGSGSDLRHARTAAGEQVVQPDCPQSTLDGLADNLAKLTGAANSNIAGTRPAGTMFVSLDSVRLAGAMLKTSVAEGFSVGDIWAAHKMIAAVLRNGLDYSAKIATTEIEALRGMPKRTLSGLGDNLRHAILPDTEASKHMGNVMSDGAARPPPSRPRALRQASPATRSCTAECCPVAPSPPFHWPQAWITCWQPSMPRSHERDGPEQDAVEQRGGANPRRAAGGQDDVHRQAGWHEQRPAVEQDLELHDAVSDGSVFWKARFGGPFQFAAEPEMDTARRSGPW
ncbi:hypothetical protein P3W85_14605 [Cupriavidus basilensis]|uniref:Uncharacterized protein n=1 Tax=Cupriavidus basilensis TaxID=68895 RepID=A0ABT6APF3_9BURK|nr:hypothetical protein [Cupriavidus basilensis]MDF3834177.1 hypothetical protein [Cupriavidus basilensis]